MKGKTKEGHLIKYSPNNTFGATDQFIIGNKVILFSIANEIFTLIIEGEEIAKTQRALFESIWIQNQERTK